MKKEIKRRLKKIEEDEEVKILYAVESGSRAWGFSSKDSDWDVRFIYHRPLNQYLKLFKNDDYLGIDNMPKEFFQDSVDFHGWDLDKTLKLLYKGNPPLLEWLESPFIYHTDPILIPELKKLSRKFYNSKRAIYHYLHMAEGNFISYITNRPHVKTKKYLYIIRPLLACYWIETIGSMPPMEIDQTFGHYVNNNETYAVISRIIRLIDRKRSGEEFGEQEPDQVLNTWILERLNYYKNYVKTMQDPQHTVTSLNKFFQDIVCSN